MAIPRLKNRQSQIPNGLKFYLPQTKFKSTPWASFDVICREVYHHVRAHPDLARQHKWPTDMHGVEEWVDYFNAALCVKMGWLNYIMDEPGGVTVPKASAPHQQAILRSLSAAAAHAKELVSGAKTLTEYLDSNEPPVSAELSTHRAIICSKCKLNAKGGFEQWFTVPASEYIRRQVERAQNRHLTTPRDDDLNLCTACHCPLKLKVHIPIDWIVKRLTDEQKAKLKQVPNCWIVTEAGL